MTDPAATSARPTPAGGPAGDIIVFVYFRAAPAHRSAIETRLRAFAAELAPVATAAVELALRDEPGAAWHTWLEHHRLPAHGDVDGYLARLSEAARRHGLDALADGGRHVETFHVLPDRCA